MNVVDITSYLALVLIIIALPIVIYGVKFIIDQVLAQERTNRRTNEQQPSTGPGPSQTSLIPPPPPPPQPQMNTATPAPGTPTVSPGANIDQAQTPPPPLPGGPVQRDVNADMKTRIYGMSPINQAPQPIPQPPFSTPPNNQGQANFAQSSPARRGIASGSTGTNEATQIAPIGGRTIPPAPTIQTQSSQPATGGTSSNESTQIAPIASGSPPRSNAIGGKVCPKCGTINTPNAKYCKNCGYKLE